MKKLVLSLTLALTAVALGAAAVAAAPVPQEGPFEGLFFGAIEGDRGSDAPIALALNHRGKEVAGQVYLGEGLLVDGGRCGSAAVPAGVQFARGRTLPGDPDHLLTEITFEVQGFEVRVDLEAEISPDGELIEVDAQIDLPWLCGVDPSLSGNLERVDPS